MIVVELFYFQFARIKMWLDTDDLQIFYIETFRQMRARETFHGLFSFLCVSCVVLCEDVFFTSQKQSSSSKRFFDSETGKWDTMIHSTKLYFPLHFQHLMMLSINRITILKQRARWCLFSFLSRSLSDVEEFIKFYFVCKLTLRWGFFFFCLSIKAHMSVTLDVGFSFFASICSTLLRKSSLSRVEWQMIDLQGRLW